MPGDPSEPDAPSTFAFVLTETRAPLSPDTLRQAWASAWPAWSPLPEIAVDPSDGDDPSLAFELAGDGRGAQTDEPDRSRQRDRRPSGSSTHQGHVDAAVHQPTLG